MIALPEHISPSIHSKDTLIPLILAVAIGVAGIVGPGDGRPPPNSYKPPQFSAAEQVDAHKFQRNTK